MKELRIVYKTEWLKLRHSFALPLAVLGAALIPVFFDGNIIFKWREVMENLFSGSSNPWEEYSRKFFNGVHFTFLPLLLVLQVALLWNIEHRAHAWKQLFVLPVSKRSLYLGKYLMLVTLVLLFYVLLTFFYLLGGVTFGLWKHDFHFLNFLPSYRYAGVQTPIGGYILRSFLSTLALLAIHFWLSFRVANLFIPISIGLGGVVLSIGMYIGHWESLHDLPYGFPVLMCNYISGKSGQLMDFQRYSIYFFIGVSVLSYIDFVQFFRGQS